MFFYKPNGNNKKDFYFFYLPVEISVIPVATKKYFKV